MRERLENNPDRAESWFWLGKHLWECNTDLEEAEQALRKAIELEPEYFPAWEEIALLLESRHKKKDAGEIWRQLGQLLLKHNHIREASLSLQYAIRCNRKDAESLHLKGLISRDNGSRDSAVKEFRKCLKLEPENAQAWLDLGITLYQLKELSEAEVALRNGLECDEIPEAWMYLGLVLADRNKMEKAVEAVRRGIRIETNPRACLWFFVGIVEFRAGNRKRAHQAFSKVLRTTFKPETKYIDSKTRGNRLRLGKILHMNPDKPTIWLKLGGMFEYQGKNWEAIFCYRQAARVDPECLDAWIFIYDITESGRDAKDALHEMIMIDMHNPDVLIRNAEDFYEFGMKAEAIQCLQEAWSKENAEYVDAKISEIQEELEEEWIDESYYDDGYRDDW